MPEFVCNICGTVGLWRGEGREGNPCGNCGSTTRLRSVILTLSRTLFGCELALPDFPVLRSLSAIGISDDKGYAGALERVFRYTNTFYHQEPRLDLTVTPERGGLYDFIICSDVLEHVPAPASRAFAAMWTLLKPEGFVLLTVPYGLGENNVEHFADLREVTFARIAGRTVLVGTNGEGQYAVRDDLVFHGGPGATAEMRIFSEEGLRAELASAGFLQVRIDGEGSERFGVHYDTACSLPVVASQIPVTLPEYAVREFAQEFARSRSTIAAIRKSRWFQLGRRLKLGPRLDLPR